mmetsp:Transcript_12950/g.46554  ORF Transcript_12950/g.46554 Transcript_12950/m.46554 type:complete len:200 (-) Transcript_12950:731-1330(-)
MMRAVQHRDFLQRDAVAGGARRLSRGELRLLDLVLGRDDGDVFTPRLHRVELERRAREALADHRPRGFHDGRRGPVIFRQHHGVRAEEIVVKLGADVRHLRAAPAVNGLVDVADDEHLPSRQRELANELVLRQGRVLELVHENVPPPLLVVLPHRSAGFQQRDGRGEQVVEVERVRRPQVRLVLVVHRREVILHARVEL